ncbi:hypothetical protein EGW08_020345 [Elysia chlorotica]|uniref:Uncharacterized protein n=1 Tax=Elysia chlorotica TaxID=188477 RepID=A0A3S1AYY6_ELYCH|nr:hypothetical protein EGW08_020345 [Elysia chlorotica]
MKTSQRPHNSPGSRHRKPASKRQPIAAGGFNPDAPASGRGALAEYSQHSPMNSLGHMQMFLPLAISPQEKTQPPFLHTDLQGSLARLAPRKKVIMSRDQMVNLILYMCMV